MVLAGPHRVLEFALALRTDDQQSDRQRRIAAAEQHVRPRGAGEQLRGKTAHGESTGARCQ
jgi:hypothetical protein